MKAHFEQQLSPTIYEGMADFYRGVDARSRIEREELATALSWLRPVQRILQQRRIAQIDNLLVTIADRIEEGDLATGILQQNTAAEYAVAIVDDGGLPCGQSADFVVELHREDLVAS